MKKDFLQPSCPWKGCAEGSKSTRRCIQGHAVAKYRTAFSLADTVNGATETIHVPGVDSHEQYWRNVKMRFLHNQTAKERVSNVWSPQFEQECYLRNPKTPGLSVVREFASKCQHRLHGHSRFPWLVFIPLMISLMIREIAPLWAHLLFYATQACATFPFPAG